MTVRVVVWKPEARGPRRWLVDVRFKKPDGSKVRDRTIYEAPTEGMAQRYGRARESQLRDGSLVVRKKEAPAFDAYARKWEPLHIKSKNLKGTSIKSIRTHVSRHLVPYFAATPLDEIDNEALENLLAWLFAKTIGKEPSQRTSRNGTLAKPRPISAKRVKNIMTTLRTMLGSAARWGDLDKLPEFPKVTVTTPAFDYYNVEEGALLLASADSPLERAVLRCALHTGMRAGELLALTWADIDMRKKLVAISKGTTDGITSTTKSGKPRYVPLTADLETALKAIKRTTPGNLVLSEEDGSALTLWMLHGILERAARRANLRLLRWHDLRHSFASNAVAHGISIFQVQTWLGHGTIAMTMRYAHLAPTSGREQLEAALAIVIAPSAAAE